MHRLNDRDPAAKTKLMKQVIPTSAPKRSFEGGCKRVLGLFALIFGMLLATPAFALEAVWNAASDVPVTASGYTASGTVSFTLNFAPLTGTSLTVVNNTAPAFINGSFDNLAQGQVVALSYGGISYRFSANYYGGSGNDLVLQWATTRLAAWGDDTFSQIGDGATTNRLAPTNVLMTGALSGKTVVAVAVGGYHTLALCSDGTLAAWGYSAYGQLGNNSFAQSSAVPVAVNTTGVLSGKTVVAVAAGYNHSMALCSDGTLAAWGDNSYGQLGNITANSRIPVAVNTAGALSGKTVVAMSGGYIIAWHFARTARWWLGVTTPPASLATTAPSTAQCQWRLVLPACFSAKRS